MKGKLFKKSTKLLIGYQPKIFKIISSGNYLVYYDTKYENDIEFKKDIKPNGVIPIKDLYEIES